MPKHPTDTTDTPDLGTPMADPEAREELNEEPVTRREAVEQELAAEGKQDEGGAIGDRID
jgi:hypothetical protein